MEMMTADLLSSPTAITPQRPSSRITSVLSDASSIRSPLADATGFPTSAVSGAHRTQLDENAASIMVGVTCMLLVLCIAAVLGRLLARRMSKLQLEADDYLALVALVSPFQFSKFFRSVLTRILSLSL
jgi:hypothetical protein